MVLILKYITVQKVKRENRRLINGKANYKEGDPSA